MDFADWIAVAGYLLAARLCARAAIHSRFISPRRDGRYWCVVAVLLLLLGINEVLTSKRPSPRSAGAHAKANGWYGEHRRVQYLFVVALGAAALIAEVAMLWFTTGMRATVRVALAGLDIHRRLYPPARGIAPPPERDPRQRHVQLQLGLGAGDGGHSHRGGRGSDSRP